MKVDTLLVLTTVGLHLAYLPDPNLHLFPLVGGSSRMNLPLALLALAYGMADLILSGRARLLKRIKMVLIALLLSLIVVTPLAATILLRARSEPHLYAHDGLIQVEQAMVFLSRGQNPYAVSYRDTPMMEWPFHEPGLTENPALDHLIYLPASFLLPWPFYLVSRLFQGWFDLRCFHLLLFLVSWIVLAFLLPPMYSTRWFVMTALIAFSPLMLPYFLEGRNDIVILAWWILATWALSQERPVWGGIFLAIACATKATAWFAVPVYGALLAYDPRFRPRFGAVMVVFCVFGLMLVLPFFLWSPVDFIRDTVYYQSIYPIKGYSLGQILLYLGVIRSALDTFPFWLPQLCIGIPTLVFVIRYIRNRPSLGRLWLGYAVLLATFGFTGRFFNDNYVGFVLTLLLGGYVLEGKVDALV